MTTQILIIGTGGAGLSTAIALFEKGKRDFLLIGDCDFKKAHTEVAEGGINAAFGNMDNEPDTPYVHAVDTFLEGQKIGNPHMVETLALNAPAAIKRLEKFGAIFHKEINGKISQRYFGAHTYRRTIFKGDETGAEIMRVLCGQVEKYNISHIDNAYVYKLIVEENKIKGVACIVNNKITVIEAPVVVLATGGYSNLYKRSSQRKNEGFGDGIGMAFEAGAAVADMEMVQFHPTGLLYPEDVAGELVTEAVRGEGGFLTNSKGERFMKKYSPQKMELATRDVVARANYQEIIEGRGTKRGGVYLDISKRDKKFLLERLPKMVKMLKKYNNIDLSKEPMEVAPTAHYTMGGILVDSNTYQTSIKGLYAVGECTVGVHGANRLGGNSLSEIIVFGNLLGSNLAKIKTHSQKNKKDFWKTYKKFKSENGSLSSHRIIEAIRNIMWEYVGISRHEKRLKLGLIKLNELRASIEKNKLKKEKTFFKTIILQNRAHSMLEMADIIAKGSLLRKESRGGHFREDYPKKNNTYLVNFLFKKKGKALKSWKKKVPAPSKKMSEAISRISKTVNYGHLE